MSSNDCSGDCAETATDDDAVGSNSGKVGCGSEDADAEEAAGADEGNEEDLVDCVVGIEPCCAGPSSKRTRFGEASFCTGGERALSH